MSPKHSQLVLHPKEVEIVLNALRFESWWLRERWHGHYDTVDQIDQLHAKLQAGDPVDLFGNEGHVLKLDKIEKKLVLDCLKGLSDEWALTGRPQLARQIDVLAASLQEAA